MYLMVAIPFGGAGHALAGSSAKAGVWSSQLQTCGAQDAQGTCTKWVDSGKPETTNTNAPKSQGSLCGDQLSCKVETVANTERHANQWMTICPITGKLLIGR